MPYYYINGFNVAKLDVHYNNVLVDTVTFPLEDSSGKKEEIQDDMIIHRLLTGKIVPKFKGTHLVWTIPFEEAARQEVSKIMSKLRMYRNMNAGHIFYLTPNIDVDERIFEVLLLNEKINLGTDAAVENASCNTGIIFSFISTNYVNENWIDKNQIPRFNLRNYKFISYT